MGKLAFPLTLAAAVFLVACGDNQPVADSAGEPQPFNESMAAKTYHCAESDISFEVTYAGDTAVLVLDGKEHLMQQAIAASGVRYVSDDGLEWHVKGDEGAFGQGDDTQMCTLAK